MKITGSSMTLQGMSTYSERTLTTENLHYWDKNTEVTLEHSGVEVTISELAYKLSDQSNQQSPEMQTTISETTEETEVNSLQKPFWKLSDADKLKIRLIERLLEAIKGQKVKLHLLDFLDVHSQKNSPILPANLHLNTRTLQSSPTAAWGMTYAASTTYTEEERTAFSATGLIKTADGQNISIALNLTMSRQFTTTTGIDLKAGNALKDPLVLNFDGKAAQLTGVNFQFDLDADGTLDNVPFVQDGNGFLALDKNGDNTINNGSELFGVRTGQGFSELAAYDDDHNNWIDENDAIFTKLRVWTKDESGKDQLFTLGEKGVGAIYLGQAKTPFALKDQSNVLQGEIRSTGIYLTDKGQARTIQQVDLSV